MSDKKDILYEIFENLCSLYKSMSIEPGTLTRIGLKPNWNVIIGTDSQCGMSMNFTGDEIAFGKEQIDIRRLQSFIGSSLMEVTEVYVMSESWQERSIGVAALSALSQPLLQPASLAERGIKVLEKGGGFAGFVKADDVAAVVGYGGWVPNLIGKCRELHVTDMRARESFQTVVIDDEITYYPTEVFVHPKGENKKVLENADVVSITGSALVNGTFEELIGYSKNARLVAMYGASSSVVPDVLFKYGVHLVQSYRLSDPVAYENGMLYERNMEPVMHSTQKSQTLCSPQMKI